MNRSVILTEKTMRFLSNGKEIKRIMLKQYSATFRTMHYLSLAQIMNCWVNPGWNWKNKQLLEHLEHLRKDKK